jgi:uncharacterized protein (DUF1684 family)
LAELGIRDRKRRLEALEVGMDIYKTGIQTQQGEERLALSRAELKLGRDKLDAEIAAAKAKGLSVNQAVFAMFNSGDPAMKAAATEWLQLNNPRSGDGDTAAKARAALEAGREEEDGGVVLDFNQLKNPK